VTELRRDSDINSSRVCILVPVADIASSSHYGTTYWEWIQLPDSSQCLSNDGGGAHNHTFLSAMSERALQR